MADVTENDPAAVDAERTKAAAAYTDAKHKLAAAGCEDRVAFHCPPAVAAALTRLDWPALQKVATLTNRIGPQAWELLETVMGGANG